MGILYRVTSPSGKSYLGITVRSLAARWNAHVQAAAKGSDLLICRAIRKYGKQSMQVETLAVVENFELPALEQRAIRALGTKVPNGYNLSDGGESGSKGYRWTAQQREQLTQSLRRSWKEHPGAAARRASARRAWAEIRARPELKARISEDVRKAWADLETGPRMRAAIREANNRPEVRAKRSELAKQQWADPEVRARMVASMSKPRGPGVGWSAERKVSQGRATSARYASPEARARHGEMVKRGWTPERRARHSETMRRVRSAQRCADPLTPCSRHGTLT